MAKSSKKSKKSKKTEAGPVAVDPAAFESVREAFISSWSELMVAWGFPKAMGTVHAHLLTRAEPQSMAALRDAAGVSQGTAHTMLKRLVGLGLVHEEHRHGVRLIRFMAERDVWQVAVSVMRERRSRELEPLLAMRSLLSQLPAADGPPVVRPVEGEFADDAEVFAATLEPFLRMADQVDGLLGEFSQQDEKWWKRLLKRWIIRA